MKKFLGIVLLLVVAMVFIGCPQPTDPADPSNPTDPTDPTDPTKVNAVEPVFESELSDIQYGLDEVGATPLNAMATVTDSGAISYQWYSNDEANTETPTMLDGETSATYMPLINASGIFYYYVVATNTIEDNKDGGTKTASITSTVATIAVSNAESDFQFDADSGNISAKFGAVFSDTIVIPSTIGGVPVTGFYGGGFRDRSMTTVFIPNGVTEISELAFSGCESLTSIMIPDTVTVIEDNAFSDCTSLESIRLPHGLTKLNRILADCTSLKNVTIPDTVTSISGAFFGCTSLESIRIPSSVTSLSSSSFGECSSLQIIDVDSDNTTYTTIGGNVYSKDETTLIAFCGGKNEVTLPNSVTTIGGSAFYYNRNLTSVTIPDGVETIGAYAFYYNTNLTSVTIPYGVEIIESNTFSNCSALDSIEIPNSITSIGEDAFSNCHALDSIDIPSSVTSIGDGHLSVPLLQV